MNDLRIKLYNAILTTLEDSQIEYNGLNDERFINRICQAVGMTELEYTDLMLENNLKEYDFEEICPHCDYMNEVSLSGTTVYKNGKRILTCKGCGKKILACSLCDCDNMECVKCELLGE